MVQILYLDGDIVVRKDIDDIFLFGLEENYVEAVQEAGGMYTKKVQKRMKKMHILTVGHVFEFKENAGR